MLKKQNKHGKEINSKTKTGGKKEETKQNEYENTCSDKFIFRCNHEFYVLLLVF